MEKTLTSSSQHLHSVRACAKALDGAIELDAHKGLAEVLVDVEKNHLTVSSTNADLVFGNCLDAFDSLGADRLSEDKHLVLDLE